MERDVTITSQYTIVMTLQQCDSSDCCNNAALVPIMPLVTRLKWDSN